MFPGPFLSARCGLSTHPRVPPPPDKVYCHTSQRCEVKLPVVSQLVISGAALEEGGLVRAPRFLPSGQTAGDAVPVGWGSRQKTDHLPDACQLGSWKETHRQRESRGQRDVPGLAGADRLPWEAMCEGCAGTRMPGGAIREEGAALAGRGRAVHRGGERREDGAGGTLSARGRMGSSLESHRLKTQCFLRKKSKHTQESTVV